MNKLVLGLCSLSLSVCLASQIITLSPLNIDSDSITTSGLSAGGFMAVQLHVAHSSLINGSAIYAAGPYYCALGNLMVAEEECMYALMGGPKTEDLIKYTNTQSSKGTIDSTENLKNDNVFIFSGSKDTVINPKVVHALEDYYREYTTGSIVTKYNLEAQHCIPTLNYGEPCSVKMSPYIGDCAYDGAGIGLKTLYGDKLVSGTAKDSNLYLFDQTLYFSGSKTSINEVGYIYIPTSCASKSVACKLHISYHGCSQDIDSIGDVWAVHSGFNSWAEANNIVVVYPYVKADLSVGNGNACWDWWGYTGADYVLQSGVQVEFTKSVIDALMGV